jgi:hypothetical protein
MICLRPVLDPSDVTGQRVGTGRVQGWGESGQVGRIGESNFFF